MQRTLLLELLVEVTAGDTVWNDGLDQSKPPRHLSCLNDFGFGGDWQGQHQHSILSPSCGWRLVVISNISSNEWAAHPQGSVDHAATIHNTTLSEYADVLMLLVFAVERRSLQCLD